MSLLFATYNLFAKVLNRESAASVDILTAVSKASKYFWMHNVSQNSQSVVNKENMFSFIQWCAIEMERLLHKPYVNEVTLTA